MLKKEIIIYFKIIFLLIMFDKMKQFMQMKKFIYKRRNKNIKRNRLLSSSDKLDMDRVNKFKKVFNHKSKIKGKRKSDIIHKILKPIYNIIGFLLFIAAYYFYYLSLEKCFKGTDACSKKLDWIKLKVIQLIFLLNKNFEKNFTNQSFFFFKIKIH